MTLAGTVATTSRSEFRIWSMAIVMLALAFQFHTTLYVFGTFIRVTAADLVMPPLLLLAAFEITRHGANRYLAGLQGIWISLALITAWLAIAMVIGRITTDQWLLWGVVNKFAGWFALLGFFGLGLVVVRIDGNVLLPIFLKTLFVSAWLIAAWGVVWFVGVRLGWSLPGSDSPNCDLRYLYFDAARRGDLPNIRLFPMSSQPECGGRLNGFMANPNAYGYFVAVVAALQIPFLKRNALFPASLHSLGLGIALTALVLSGSRSAWLGFAFGLALLAYLREIPFKRLAASTAVALLFLGLGAAASSPDLLRKLGHEPNAERIRQSYFLSSQIAPSESSSVTLRLEQAQQAFDLWLSSPVVGTGLGRFLWEQRHGDAETPSTVHNTGLWLLAETGIVGAALVVGFFLISLRILWPAKDRIGGDDPFRVGVASVLLVFAGASIGMEAMYQRHLWFLLGAALGLVPRRDADATIAQP